MNGDSSHMMAEIRAAIAQGTLTHIGIERRLEAAIAAETSKKDAPADIALIRACQSLLWELDTHGKEAFADHTEQSMAAFTAKKTKASGWRKAHLPLQIAAITAAILLVTFGIGTLAHWEWLEGHPTDDEQQYVVQGQTIDTDLIEKGQANEDPAGLRDVTTTSLNDAIAVLGFTPKTPHWLPDGWTLYSYTASDTAAAVWFTATYSNAAQEYSLIYQAAYYKDVEQAQTAFEQNRMGEECTMPDGKTVYMAENYDDTTCVWYEDLVCYSLMGPENQTTFIKIIDSIGGNP